MEDDDLIDLAYFRSAVDDPRHQPDPYVLAELSSSLHGFARGAREAGIDDDFIRSVRQSILDGFKRLDALPRDDPFWDRTNRRPTFHKLYAFCINRLAGDSLDDRALWTLAAVAVVSVQNFDPALWLPFAELGGLEPSWPISAALYVDLVCGTDSVTILASLLVDNGLCERARPTMARLAQSDRHHIRSWASRVGDRCQIGGVSKAEAF
jgi:hypothetical protein